MRPNSRLTAVGLATGLVLTGCALSPIALGGSGGDTLPNVADGTPYDVLNTAIDQLDQAGSARIAIQEAADGKPGELNARGAADFTNRQAVLELDTNVGTIEVISDGEAVYYTTGSLALPDGKRWVGPGDLALSLASSVAAHTVNTPVLVGDLRIAGLAAFDPATVEILGPEEVQGGGTATHYRVDVDGDPTEMWVDEQGRMRKYTYDTASEDASIVDGSGVVELWDYGVDVDAAPPPDSEVLDLTDIGLTDPLAEEILAIGLPAGGN